MTLSIIWNKSKLFKYLYLRLDGVHLFMSYIGCIGTLVAGYGLQEILGKGFCSIPKILTGKKYPQCVQAQQMVVEK